MRPIRFIFAVHNHQPIGNFSHIFEQTYQESYLPFLDVFEGYSKIKLALHTSGSLFEWLANVHPEYLIRVAELVRERRIEVIGGPFFEPILAMLPARDRIGQIEMYSEWLQKRLGADVAGIWIPERVWEQSYVRDLVAAGMKYTILDDSHLKFAGVKESALNRHYLTEDDGKTMTVFPGSERLRYLIPFGNVENVISHFAEMSEKDAQSVLVHGDDGEKFGSWPETSRHVYEEKWLHRFFDALSENSDWIVTTTPSEVIASVPPLGKIYIPDGSYREMTEWVLEPEQQMQLDQIRIDMANDEKWPILKQFLRGGFWRNFKVRYPESDEMYCRMMSVSARLRKSIEEGWSGSDIDLARESLYRSQCNCGYWHGAFGGVYLPHLRNAIYKELIQADNLIDAATDRTGKWAESQMADFNFDGQNEVRLTNDQLNLLVVPHRGGMMYEMDIKSIAHNLLATVTRCPEPYHQKIEQRQQYEEKHPGQRVIFKQEGLERRLQYDSYPRKSLVDLFYDYDVNFESVSRGHAKQHGDFVHSEYDAVIRKKAGRMQILLSREGTAYMAPIRIDKAVTLSEGSSVIEIAYRLSQLPKDYRLHFAVEMNFAGMPGGAENRYFHGIGGAKGKRFGNLSTNLDLTEGYELGLYDDWLGLDVALKSNRLTDFYAFPIETVSQSVEGFELVHQSVAVQPHWHIIPDETGVWSVEMEIHLDTSAAQKRDLDARHFLKDAARMLVGELKEVE
ncbi:MAG: alpha-amylase/4-alpha-glucanotransferase domain-containing protein [Thermoguttaceae bacterium]